MSDCLNHIGDRGDAGRLSDLRSDGKEGDMIVRKRPQRFGNEVRHQIALRRCVGALAIMLVTGLVPVIASAAECPVRREPNIPAPDGSIAKDFNIDTYKRQLTEYQKKGYNSDIVAVMEKATRYVLDRALERAGEVKRPAVVLDIDETSLSNWDNIKADDYGFIEGGACPLQAKMACGFNDWIDMAIAPAIEPTLKFFNAIRAKEDAVSRKEIPNIAVFFISGRREQQRRATLWNLDRAGFKGWTGIATRPDEEHGTIVPFKSRERYNIAERYTILANIGDQDSDLEDLKELKDLKGPSAECAFKLPNPFYFIP
jgi:predicted secreted acid phosphatase